MTTPFVKSRSDAPAGFFEVEAAGLRWLDVPGGVPVAEPLHVSPTQLATTRLHMSQPTESAAEVFGRRLAVTHDAGARYFGVPPDGWSGDGYIGTIPLPHALEPVESWGEFYANLRLRPYLRAAHDQGIHLNVIERICTRLEAGVYDDSSDEPCRIHGDLWSGNVLWTPDGVHLIDPAAHGGHRETDLAMLALFGLPRLDRVLLAYDETHPLRDGWQERIGLHQLHPLLVHVVLFGGGYAAQAVESARRY
ncbi:fructosamine-3-kinase [Kribbella sp. VKM Ac-2569]|uniref:fructosamine kinase family protein n=1 Tax=Kribbella sp. VKM Ac-2569 TaxID=2512220 RepID=UPI00102C0044|nr:fructosamine kinase family protein [Kribbella sp. VKM Ac-2569]RZT17005.1 fructosamine-3-kinase [Kribbella sp. VKM Ac-2569]